MRAHIRDIRLRVSRTTGLHILLFIGCTYVGRRAPLQQALPVKMFRLPTSPISAYAHGFANKQHTKSTKMYTNNANKTVKKKNQEKTSIRTRVQCLCKSSVKPTMREEEECLFCAVTSSNTQCKIQNITLLFCTAFNRCVQRECIPTVNLTRRKCLAC